jgi:hypothetical protein
VPQGTLDQWLAYGLGLPQYSKPFAENAVTVLDFPLLLREPSLLQHDLGVNSALHRRQITRAMRNVVLGIGALPAPVENVRHDTTADGTAVVSWDLPHAVRSAGGTGHR